MRNNPCFFIFTFLLLLAEICSAQLPQVRFNRVKPLEQAPWNVVTGIVQDQQGYMWFSSGPFLYRYDGYQILTYRNDPLNPNSLAGITIETIYADRKGTIWIGYLGSGLDQYNPATGTFVNYHHLINDPGSLINDTVSAIIEDHEGILWVGTHGGLNRLDIQTGKFTHFEHNENDIGTLSNNMVRALYKDTQGTLWVGTGSPFSNDSGIKSVNGGLNRLDRKTGKFIRYLHDPNNPHSLIDNRVRAIFEDSRGVFWVGTAGDGLHTMDRATGVFERHLYDPSHPEKLSRPSLKKLYDYADDHITFIKEDAAGAIWIGTMQNGLNRYDPKTRKISHYDSKDSLAGFGDDSGWWAYTSREGVLWVSTWGSNLYRIAPFSINIPHYEITGNVSSFYEEPNGILWIGTNNGLVRNDQSNGTSTRFLYDANDPSGISNNRIFSISKGHQGDLWIGTEGGLNHFDLQKQSFTHYRHDKIKDSLMSDIILTTYQDQKGNIWIGTANGLDRMNPETGVFTHYQSNPKDSNTVSIGAVTSIREDRNNSLWIGTWSFGLGGGINLLNTQTGKFKRYVYVEYISCIYLDADSILWVGTYYGLHRFNRALDNFSIFSDPTSGIGFNYVTYITEDDKKNLWIGTAKGIIKLNRNRNESTIYGKNQGVQENFLSWRSGYKAPDGKLFFGTERGYYAFTPDQLVTNQKPPEILLSEFRIGDQPVKSGQNSPLREPIQDAKEIRLRYNQNVFSFDFATIDYNNPEDNRNLYMLENYETTWRQASSERKAYYFNVPPGRYVFRLKAANSNGVWTEKAITIIITPPWWKTWWAYTLYALILVAAIWTFIAYRSRQLKRENRLLEEKVVHRTKQLEQKSSELETSLKDLKATQSQLIQSEKMASLGEVTAGIAHEIQNPLNFVNNFSEVNSELIIELKQEIDKGNLTEIKTFVDNIAENEQKIIFHGKRADAIVKGMLQHSRMSHGVKDSTNINALSGEYLRLAYHGLRAKDSSFNAMMKTDFDESIGNIHVIPQDIGRVLLNLYMNAFQAVAEKKKQEGDGYEPTVSISTKKTTSAVEIKVKDNGNGIPPRVLDKIFQPFFTTKPAGQGTGLGLSLAYDIVKAHGGELRVETKEGVGSEFTIELPLDA